MKINPSNQLEIESGETWLLHFESSPNVKEGFEPDQLILFPTERDSLDKTIAYCQKRGNGSYHLIVGKNGVDWVQMVPFNVQTQRNFSIDRSSITIALDYAYGIKDTPVADPHSYLEAIAGNNKLYKVALYPPEQLDALLKLSMFLQEKFGLHKLLISDEVSQGRLSMRPAFPKAAFAESLYEATRGKIGNKVVLKEVIHPVILLNSPDVKAVPLMDQPLPPGSPVGIHSEWQDWLLVELVGVVGDQRWKVGWLDRKLVQAKKYFPVVRNHLLLTTDDRTYQFIPAATSGYNTKNVMKEEEINFIVMHFTTGTRIESTINTFTNSDNAVSAHLVIGRDGEVIQMVPFNRSASHCGGGYWEGKSVYEHSIGIELDNAGYKLTLRADGDYNNRDYLVKSDDVIKKPDWKSKKLLPWQKFPQIQLDIMESILIALKIAYPAISELLEHERISLLTRSDPGPEFEMAKFRKSVLNQDKLNYKVYRTKKDTNLYENIDWNPPPTDIPSKPINFPSATLQVLGIETNYLVPVNIVKCDKKKNLSGSPGWVRMKADYFKGKTVKTDHEIEFFRGEKPPSVVSKKLLKGTEARVQRESNGWSLVSTPEFVVDYIFLEGWIRMLELEEVPGQ
jgi:N-acetylmuramoyl-L-alanine amidase